jgi:hypothetical protein
MKNRFWTIVGDRDSCIGGKFGEIFPPDLTAAFSWPSEDLNDGYIAYLFKRDKYCKRTKLLKSGKKVCV